MLGMIALSAPVSGWEMKLEGEWEWRFRYWTRTGTNDIFGSMDSTFVNLGVNHLNTWPNDETQKEGWAVNPAPTGTSAQGRFGVVAGENNWGPDASIVDLRLTLFPIIRVNEAITFTAGVNLTSLGLWSGGQPLDILGSRGYINSLYVPLGSRPAAADVPNTAVTLQWLEGVIRTPIVDLSVGYKTTRLGMGLWKHEENRASASFAARIGHGPLRIGFSSYFSRRNSDWRAYTGINTGPRAQMRKEGVRNYLPGMTGRIEYRNASLEVVCAFDVYTCAQTPNTNARYTDIRPAAPTSSDEFRYRLHASSRYHDGTFFWNWEVDSFNRLRSGRATANEAGTLVNEGRDVHAWLYGTEMGALFGPNRFTVNYVYASGDNPSTRTDNEDAQRGDSGVNDGYMRHWGYLMYHMYGTGTNFGANGYGFPSDFHHFGLRLDRSVAANLNVWALVAYALRDQPNSYVLGGDWAYGLRKFTNDELLETVPGSSLNDNLPNPVPDHAREIGWEVDFGLDWQILENLTWRTTFAYWKPGNWWSYAYPNTANLFRVNNGAAPNANSRNNYINTDPNAENAATFGLGRDIAPLFAIETNLLVQF
jgi:hypothetical protein